MAAHPHSISAKAATAYLGKENKHSDHPLAWFSTVDKHLNRFDYLVDRQR